MEVSEQMSFLVEWLQVQADKEQVCVDDARNKECGTLVYHIGRRDAYTSVKVLVERGITNDRCLL